MSYIERETALQIINNYAKAVTEDGKVVVDAIRDIVEVITPTADVVEVVRCKDCKLWESYENTSGAGYCHNKKFSFTYGAMLDKEFTPITMPDEFCSYGERREKNANC